MWKRSKARDLSMWRKRRRGQGCENLWQWKKIKKRKDKEGWTDCTCKNRDKEGWTDCTCKNKDKEGWTDCTCKNKDKEGWTDCTCKNKDKEGWTDWTCSSWFCLSPRGTPWRRQSRSSSGSRQTRYLSFYCVNVCLQLCVLIMVWWCYYGPWQKITMAMRVKYQTQKFLRLPPDQVFVLVLFQKKNSR